MAVTLRPECLQDEPFIHRLVLETIAGELGISAWPEPMRSHLPGVQYAGRRQSHRVNYPTAVSQVIEADGAEAGWAVVDTRPDEVRIVDIMVLPELRGRGIGAAAIRGIQAAAAESGKPVRLNVYITNYAAIRLYERLGFRRTGGDETQHYMEVSGLPAGPPTGKS
jgi:ribosomal protein S18 acetylase RimI-like enzyme